MKVNFTYIICLFLFLSSCQSIKDGLTGKKSENSDEFLVIKKNPLELPPSYGDLPEPKSEASEDFEAKVEENIEELIENVSKNEDKKIESNDKSAEDFVLEKIKNN